MPKRPRIEVRPRRPRELTVREISRAALVLYVDFLYQRGLPVGSKDYQLTKADALQSVDTFLKRFAELTGGVYA